MLGAEVMLAVCWWLSWLPADALPTRAESAAIGGVTVRIVGLDPTAGGHVAMAIFDRSDRFDERRDPVARAYVPVKEETHEWIVDRLPPGDYAVTAYQDRNGNRILDKGRLGIPKEPYGFSNDVRGRFGPPSFARAKVSITDRSQEIASQESARQEIIVRLVGRGAN